MNDNKKIIIANWKMALHYDDSVQLAKIYREAFKSKRETFDIVICPSFVTLHEIYKVIEKSSVKLGAQDCFWEEVGSYTGEISPVDLKNIGCKYVMMGHSERRKNLNETNSMVHNKVKAALKNNLIPIVCIGETWEERRGNKKDFTLMNQLTEALEGLTISTNDQLIVAYEPVWAISSGEGIEAEPEEVQYANNLTRQILLDLFNSEIVKHNFRIIYGGSVDSENVNAFMQVPTVSGVLVGSASQRAEKFITLVESIY